jgi:hypothetical protein
MIEEINTNNDYESKVLPDGHLKLTVFAGTPRKAKTTYWWKFKFAADDGSEGEGEIGLFGNQMRPLLKALGCVEGSKPGWYVLNSDITDGGKIEAVIYTDDKGYKRMKDITGSGIPY